MAKRKKIPVVSFMVDEVVGGFFVNVPPGQVACIYDMGFGVLKRVLKPGLHLKIPFWQVVKLFNAQILEYNISDAFVATHKEALGSKPLNAVTADNKEIKLSGSVLFRLDKENAPEIWENVGEEFVSKVVRPLSSSVILSIIAGVTFQELNQNRKAIENKIDNALDKQFEYKGLICEGVLLSELREI
jgi:regulator of protease activity HflC (stomatin/prohibitin superfamily)